jgi:cold shock CspA family protein
MKQGIIVVFNEKKFWGFVREDSTSEEYFFHQDNCPGFKPYLAGRVEFEIAAPLRIGLRDQAINLRSLDEAEGGEV